MPQDFDLTAEEFRFKLGDKSYSLDLIEAEMALDSHPILIDQLNSEGVPEPERYIPLFQKWLATREEPIEVNQSQAFKLIERIRFAYLDFKKKFNEGLTLDYASAATHFSLLKKNASSLQPTFPEFEQEENLKLEQSEAG